MECDAIQAALSARLDGEDPGIADDVVDAHLSICKDCQLWFERTVSLNRSLLIHAVQDRVSEKSDPVTDAGIEEAEVGSDNVPTNDADPATARDELLEEKILASVEPKRRARARRWRIMSGTARTVLVVLGFIWIIWGGTTLGVAAANVGEELGGYAAQMAAIRIALGAGLLWAAWRTRVAAGIAPVYGAIAMFSTGFSTIEWVISGIQPATIGALALMIASAVVLAMVWLGGYTPAAIAGAWRAAAGSPIRGVPPS